MLEINQCGAQTIIAARRPALALTRLARLRKFRSGSIKRMSAL
jgi:hypothetical protein